MGWIKFQKNVIKKEINNLFFIFIFIISIRLNPYFIPFKDISPIFINRSIEMQNFEVI